MRNFEVVPATEQVGLTAAQLAALEQSQDGKFPFISSVTNKWKAYEKKNGNYVRWTGDSYDTAEEAVAALN